MHNAANPLSKHFRQAKLYISLPSRGNFYQPGSFEFSETGEYPVLAMTAKDELRFKTPDALLNGQATVEVIQSCVPNVKNAWDIPVIDLDAILIAIRIATYGETMDLTTVVPGTDLERTYSADLRLLLDKLNSQTYDNVVVSGDFKIELTPLTYRHFTETALKTFEEQRIFMLLNNDNMTEAEKLLKFNESFSKLTDLNIGIVLKSIASVQFQNETPVTNKQHIAEFFENADKDIFSSILAHIETQRKKFAIQPLEVQADEELIAAGAPEKLYIPITFDQSSFFGKGS